MLKSYAQQKYASASDTITAFERTPLRSNVHHPPRKGQSRRRPEQPPESNTRVCLDFDSMTSIYHKLLYMANAWIDAIVIKLTSSVGQKFQRGEGGKMVLIAVKTVPTSIKPKAVDGSMHTSKGGRCGFGTSAPLLTRASPTHFPGAFKRGSPTMPRLVKFVGPSSTLVKELSPFFTRSSQRPLYACESSCQFPTCLRGETWLPSFMLQAC